jgi:hypothetical protein
MFDLLANVARFADVAERLDLPDNAISVHAGLRVEDSAHAPSAVFGIRYARRVTRRLSVGGLVDASGPLGHGEWHDPSLSRTGPTVQVDAFPVSWIRLWVGASVWGYYREEGYYLYSNDRWTTGVGADANVGFDIVGANVGISVFAFAGAYRSASFGGVALGPTFRF